ncbi:uncharacterized protein CcaverHIS019_0304580 [Cutaneotrichosporon cavernicola]|uniref:Uncharacterized protein n=1 Tax=Cutaneotrichosporon cavernicola TaxID=279322 RepID=A0AA48IGS3_9TREE|nr:uncharacterized protein CcaverHIS019_0304580 [Cutaneotrichosporon cavernicola]BEI90388.1 hypothetical protein CcaverHIS019_0304580 [Cutaneotrichosporon cavernicola]
MDNPLDLPGIHSAATSTEGTPAPPSPRFAPPSPAPDLGETKADARARRIATAVVRSRTEYKLEHGYTERGWFLSTDQAGPSKKDRQHVEYASTYRATVPQDAEDAARALADIRALPPKQLPRELITTAIRAAILAHLPQDAASLAREARTHWRANVGLAVEASAALAGAGAVAGLEALTTAVDALAASRAWAFGPLFLQEGEERGMPRPVEGGAGLRAALAAVEVEDIARALELEDTEERKLLQAAKRRMEGALGRQVDEVEAIPGERVERGVREL